MARNKRPKFTRTPPPDELRCTAKTAGGQRCKKAKEKDSNLCKMHSGDFAAQIGKKGAAATNERVAEFKALAELGKQLAIGKSWEEKINYYNGRIATEKNIAVRMEYERLHHKAMDCRDKYKSGGQRVILVVQQKGEAADWPEPKGERPEPTPFDGGEQQFRPPNGGSE